MLATLPLQLATSAIPTLESTAQGYSFLDSINDDDYDDDEDAHIHEESVNRSSFLPTTVVKKSDVDTDTNRGSFTEDEMSSLDDEGMEQTRTARSLSNDDSKLYYTPPQRTSRISQIPAARAALKRDYSLSMARRKQLEDLENSNFSEETIQQIRSTLIQSGKYLNQFCKIAEQQSSSDPDSDYEPSSYRGRHRRYVYNKFTNNAQHKVKLIKTDCSPDFGFSISDSAAEPGIYIHKIKVGGPAEVNGLKPYDRILKVSYHL